MALSNLPDRNPFFTGRDDVLAQLQEALAERGRAALSGLGGVGKTQTAVEYANRHLNEYDYTFWAIAHSQEALVSSYLTVAGLLNLPESKVNEQATAHSREAQLSNRVTVAGLSNLPESSAKKQPPAVDAVKRWLGSHQRWLLILDNADDLGMACAFIPSGKKGHLILTTRAQAVGAIARRVEIQEMGTDEGALFLLRRAKYITEDALIEAASPADQGEAKAIAAQLEGLPLALDQAGAYIEKTGCGLSGYLSRYRTHGPELLQRRGSLKSDHSEEALKSEHPDPVAATWALSFEKIEQANPAAAELLRFCAFLQPDQIPEEVFSKGVPELGPVLERVGADALVLDDAIAELLKYSLIRRDPNARILEIHRLVQAVLKLGMDEVTERLWAERAVRAVSHVFPEVELSTWTVCERLLPQAYACAELIKQYGFEFSEAARLLNQAGFYSYERGRYTDAEAIYQRALAIREKTLGPHHADVAMSLNNLAELYRAQGKYAKAEPLFERALAIREKALGPEHPDVAHSLNGLAALYDNQDQYAKAEPLFERALAIREKALGPEHPAVATSLHSLALFYRRVQGQYAKAEPLYQRALGIQEKALGPEHPDVAKSLNGLARLYYNQGQYAKAEPLFERALAIREKALGPEHTRVAISLKDLAELYRAQGQYAKAEPLYQRALVIREKALGPENPDVARSLNNLAELYADQRQYTKAEALFERALAIREKALGPEHSEVAKSLHNLAKFYANQDQYAKAELLYQRALVIFEKALGPEHPDVATSLENYALCLRAMGRSQEAESLEARANAIRAKRA